MTLFLSLVETVEGQNRDLHGEDSAEGKGRSLTTVGSDWKPRPEPIPPSSPAGTGAATARCSPTAASRLRRSAPAPRATRCRPASVSRTADRRRSARRPWPPCARGRRRSEEHTSELQSLMRISYAVFCLKKKRNK